MGGKGTVLGVRFGLAASPGRESDPPGLACPRRDPAQRFPQAERDQQVRAPTRACSAECSPCASTSSSRRPARVAHAALRRVLVDRRCLLAATACLDLYLSAPLLL